MAWDSASGIDREELRAAILDLVRIAALWEGGALEHGHAETRAADERLLRTVAKAIAEHQSGAKSVPVGRIGRHVVRRVDLRLARVHQRVAAILRDLKGPLSATTLELLRATFSSSGVKGVTLERITGAIARLSNGVEPQHWLHARGGPDMAAAELMSTVGPRSGRYVFLVKQIVSEQAVKPIELEVQARGRLPTRRVLIEYALGVLGIPPRTIRRVLDVLYGKRVGPRRPRRRPRAAPARPPAAPG